MDIKVSGHEYFYDITSMSMLFFPGEKTFFVNKSSKPTHIISSLKVKDGKYVSVTKVKHNSKWFTSTMTAGRECDTKNLVKQTFYKACVKATGITSLWGILTGIRPLSVYMRHLNDAADVRDTMKREYFLDDSKIGILDEVYSNEKKFLISNKNDVSLYVSIPFCPSKCSYCSFISVSATGKSKLLDDYVLLLGKEISGKARHIRKYGLNVKSIYIGGGTPGILSEEQITCIFSLLSKEFDLKNIEEISFELGRPETVTDEKLLLLKKFGVTRICINTQTLNDTVLSAVNRKHSASDYFRAVDTAKRVGFENINTDIIAGLPGEDFDSFCNSLDGVIGTGVNNITVHTLAIKRAAELSGDSGNYRPVNDSVTKMLEYSYGKLYKSGYSPYYIYRQKNCVSNGENVGFCKKDAQCKYNIFMMEDVHSVISCGAGASTKIIDGSKVSRIINVKYPMEYVKVYDRIKDNTEKTDALLKEIFENE